jgi:rubredoxin
MELVRVMCAACNKGLDAPAPKQQLMNFPNTSIMVVEHPERFVCPHCGIELTLFVRQAQTGLVAVPAPAKPSGLVLAQG